MKNKLIEILSAEDCPVVLCDEDRIKLVKYLLLSRVIVLPCRVGDVLEKDGEYFYVNGVQYCEETEGSSWRSLDDKIEIVPIGKLGHFYSERIMLCDVVFSSPKIKKADTYYLLPPEEGRKIKQEACFVNSFDNIKSAVLTEEEAEAILNQNKEQAKKDLEEIIYKKPHKKRYTPAKNSLRQKLRRILRRR